MKDRIPLYPGRVKLNPVTGQENTYDMVRADEPTQDGTPLNKASLLQDETAALYGLGVDAVPNDILSILSKAVLAVNGNLQDISGSNVGIRIATGSYVGTGTYGPSNPSSLTFDFVPKLVIVTTQYGLQPYGDSYYSWAQGCLIWHYNQAYLRTFNGTLRFTRSGNTLSWYFDSSVSGAENQCNASATTYYYTSIG